MSDIIQPCIDKIKGKNPYQRDSSGGLAGLTEQMWDKGTTFKIKFLGGDPKVVEKVKKKFELWLPHANTLKFVYVDDGDADVRVAFEEGGGHWSNLGKEIHEIPENRPTMNLGWPHDREIPDEEIERVATHEMGHTLGFIHEQSQPKANIDWDEDAVYKYFAETQGWDKETTFHNVLERYSEQITQFTDYDPNSIMHYAFPGFLTKSGRDILGGTKLSNSDIGFARQKYAS